MRHFTPFKLAALSAAATLLLGTQGCTDSSQAGKPSTPLPTVVVQEVKLSEVPLQVQLPGRTTPYQVAEVRPQVGGVLLARHFREGGSVKAGEPLYQIDPARYKAQLDSAKASLAKARATVVSTQLKHERFTELVELDAVSKQERDEAKSAMLSAQAELAAAQAAVDTAQINLEYTQVRSPIAGRIGRSSATTGALVTAGQSDALATVLQLDPIYVDLSQSSQELLRLKESMQAGAVKSAGASAQKVKLLMENGQIYPQEGVLQFAEVNVDPSTGTVTLRAVFPNPQGLLLPGMFVNAVLTQGSKAQAMLVPQKAVTRNSKGEAVVLVLNAEGTVEQRVLKTDNTLGADWIVSSGLNAGERVIVEGVQKVKPGGKATVAEPTAPPAAATPASKP